MAHARSPLTTWLLAVYLLSRAKPGLSALALKRPLGVRYPAAGRLHQKINGALATQDGSH